MSMLRDVLIDEIATTGPLRFDAYMARALLDPKMGYYTQARAIGAAGDFVTAPEISQMFGELIGLCFVQYWMDLGQPERVVLAELGPGHGTLMADVLRVAQRVPGFAAALRVALIEASPSMRKRQQDTLKAFDVNWIETVDDLPKLPIFVLANEFFDALPIRQFQWAPSGWQERYVATDAAGLCTQWHPIEPHDHDMLSRFEGVQHGDIVEVCPQLTPMIADLTQRIERDGGAGLVIDYGDWHSLGDTVQSLSDHKPIDPLAAPGQSDLTAHVDFEALAQAAQCSYAKLATQGVFLERLGITARAQSLAKSLTGEALETHIAAHNRLTHPQEMGALFKVMGFYQSGKPCLPGLEP